jgi:deazaflavin-dependent oxidoreductase (nitroreductase family)
MAQTAPTALDRGGIVDITTTGRHTGEPRRIEIALHRIGDRYWISGMPHPRRRSWIANLAADPRMTIHLTGTPGAADVPATARVVDDPAERREVLEHIARIWRRTDVDRMVAQSPLIEVTPTLPG